MVKNQDTSVGAELVVFNHLSITTPAFTTANPDGKVEVNETFKEDFRSLIEPPREKGDDTPVFEFMKAGKLEVKLISIII